MQSVANCDQILDIVEEEIRVFFPDTMFVNIFVETSSFWCLDRFLFNTRCFKKFRTKNSTKSIDVFTL